MQNRKNLQIVLGAKLLIQLGDIIIPLGLVAISSNRGSQTILLAESRQFKTSSVVTTAVSQNSLITFQWLLLLIHQPDITMETYK